METLIDMDLVAFRAAASAEEEDNAGIAISRMNKTVDTIITRTEASSFRAFLSGPGSYRKEIDPLYKANRTAPKPKHLASCKDYCIDQLGAEVTEGGIEADDALGIYQDKVGGTTTIATLDKDLLMIPGKHYAWEFGTSKWTKPERFFEQDELGGLRMFYEQCLKGDTADNIKGLSKVGDVKARKFLAGAETEVEMFNIVYELYNNEKEFLKNARCLYIMQHHDDDYLRHFERLMDGQIQIQLGESSMESPDWEVS